MITRLLLWLRAVLLRRRLEREMTEEMASHIDLSTARLRARGLSPVAARRAAMREFGNVVYLQEEARLARGTSGLDSLQGDVRFATRQFARNLLSTLTTVAVLSIGIAVNVVLFTMVHSLDQPPSGIVSSEELVRIRGSQRGPGTRVERAFTLAEVEAYTGVDSHFSAVAAWASQPVTAGGPGLDEITVTATFVTDAYFDALGVHPVIGSRLDNDAGRVAVLSHAAWTRIFAANPAVLGRTLALNGVPFSIVAVAPPRFRGAYLEAQDGLQVWLPAPSRRFVLPDVSDDAELFRAVARLQPGVTREAATAAVAVVARRMASDRDRAAGPNRSPSDRDPAAEVAPLLAGNVAPGFEAQARVGKLAFGVLGLLTLLVTCANVSTLQTGLAFARRREIAIRMSLGASRCRVIRQLVTESLLLAVLAAGAATGVTLVILRVLMAISEGLSFVLVFDRAIFCFTAGVALAAGLLFGISPALHATRVALAGALRDSATAIAGGRARLQRGLVVAQIGLTQPLAVCIATLVLFGIIEYRQSPRNPYGEQIVQLRFATANTRQLFVAADTAAAEHERSELDRLVEALRRIPGITAAVHHPSRVLIDREAFSLSDAPRSRSNDGEPFQLVGHAVAPGYLDLIGVPILLGRDIEPDDTAAFRAGAIPVIIGEDMARRLWPAGNPVGRRLEKSTATADRIALEVVGVYAAANHAVGSSGDDFTIFLPADPRRTSASTHHHILLRTSSPPETMMPVIRGVVRTEVERAAITGLRTLASVEDEARFTLLRVITLFSTAGIVVLVLSALGLYAVIAFAVGQRTREIAVRAALGASAWQIMHHFASQGLRLGTLGIVLGLPFSVLGLHWLLSLAPGVPDVSLALVTTIVAIGVLGVSSVASWHPAWRAAQVDPATVLRCD